MVITGNDARIAMPAVALAVLLSLTVARTAAASAFTDSCIAGGGGMFEAKDCSCMESKAGADDQTTLTAFFKANAPGSKPDEALPQMQKGMELLNKYLGQCMK